MSRPQDLTFEEADAILYTKDGKLYWKIRVSRNSNIGKEAGHLDKHGYRRFRYKARNYFSHRVIFTLVNGHTPNGDCDHINRDKLDNYPSNLRDLSRRGNCENRKLSTTNKSGVTGVYKYRGKWKSVVQPSGKFISLGMFDDFTEAVAHRLAAEQFMESPTFNSPALVHMSKYLAEVGVSI